MSSKKYSLIIPTRNGAKYINAPIETILSQDFLDMELIVSVNHSDDGTLDRLKNFSDPRLKVITPPKILSMGGHYEWCLRQAKGEWVTIIGDDDGVMPFFFDEAERLLERWKGSGVEAFSFRRAYYFWPGCEASYGDIVLSVSGHRREYKMWPKLALFRAVLFDLNHFDLPQIYTNNLVRRDLIERIIAKSGGSFYHELNPDVYSGVAVAILAKKWVRSEWPIFWTGTSPKSVGMATAVKSRMANSEKDIFDLESCEGQNQDFINRSNEFFTLSQADGVGVASEIGLKAWQGLRSSHIWVLSALLMTPLISQIRGGWKRFFIIGACARTLQSLSANNGYIQTCEQKQLVKDILLNNGINLRLFSFLRHIWVINHFVSVWRRGFFRLSMLVNRHERVKISSNSHVDYPDLITAQRALSALSKQEKGGS